MRATDGLQTTITLGPVNGDGQTISLELSLYMSLPMPSQDEHLPDQIEASVHQAGLDIQRQLFKVLMEKADQELVLQRRHGKGGAGIQRRGTRPFTFKTVFGNVTVQRSRICHKYDDTMEVPSAIAWNTSHQLHITQNLRDDVCDQMRDQSAGKTLRRHLSVRWRREPARADDDHRHRASGGGTTDRRATRAGPLGADWGNRVPIGLARPHRGRP